MDSARKVMTDEVLHRSGSALSRFFDWTSSFGSLRGFAPEPEPDRSRPGPLESFRAAPTKAARSSVKMAEINSVAKLVPPQGRPEVA